MTENLAYFEVYVGDECVDRVVLCEGGSFEADIHVDDFRLELVGIEPRRDGEQTTPEVLAALTGRDVEEFTLDDETSLPDFDEQMAELEGDG
ncbi:hypothetical protein [Halopelagius fulvigenes]|uniref:Uncharacterized protein n=1 Tax=Halopelagius fulvigenes TaxID=1198324 RepID=A0ABD5U2G7_9EURY